MDSDESATKFRELASALIVQVLWLVALALPVTAFALDLQGHRGARGLAPENSLAACATAIGLGVTTLELDVGATRDGALVIAHDPSSTRI